jgi:hypothetical protein
VSQNQDNYFKNTSYYSQLEPPTFTVRKFVISKARDSV